MYQKLNNPPVKIALFQLKFNAVNIKVFETTDTLLRHKFNIRKDNIEVGLNLDNTNIPLGKARLNGTSDAKIKSYIYLTPDQKERVEVLEDTLTYVSELPYSGWENFIAQVDNVLKIFTNVLSNVEIKRTSIRFINRFLLDEFENPEDYFTTVISKNGDTLYPLRQYGFRLQYDIPQTNIYAIVNQSVINDIVNKFAYVLDIDVLDKQSLFYEKETILSCMSNLRNIKNKIFFDSITEKTTRLCD